MCLQLQQACAEASEQALCQGGSIGFIQRSANCVARTRVELVERGWLRPDFAEVNERRFRDWMIRGGSALTWSFEMLEAIRQNVWCRRGRPDRAHNPEALNSFVVGLLANLHMGTAEQRLSKPAALQKIKILLTHDSVRQPAESSPY